MNKENVPKRKSENIEIDIDDLEETFSHKKIRYNLSEKSINKNDTKDFIYLVQTDENNNDVSNKTLNSNSSEQQSSQVVNEENKDDLDPIIVLQQLLKDVKTLSSHSVGGHAFQLPSNPGLYIQNYGYVPLPLNKTITNELFDSLQKNNNDQLIRNFQIDSSLIEIRNKDWDQNLEYLIQQISDELCFYGKIVAKLNKLIIYNKGENDQLENHDDDIKSKTDNVIANLIIQLPSVYEGGQLVIQSKKEDQNDVTFDFSNNLDKTKFYPFYVAHFAEDESKVLELKDGIKAVFVYSLHCPNKHTYELNKNRYHLEKLSYCLKKISKNQDNLYAILLDNKYSWQFQQGYGVDSLENMDKERYLSIKNANDSLELLNQMNFHLVNSCIIIKSFIPADDHSKNGRFLEKTKEELDNQDWSYHVCESKINWFYENGGLVGFNAKMDVFTKIIDPNSNEDDPFIQFNEPDSLNFEKEVYYERTDNGYVRIAKLDLYFLAFWPVNYQFEAFMKIDRRAALWELMSLENDQGFQPYLHFDQRFKNLVDYLKENRDETLDENNVLMFFDKYRDLDLCKYYLNNITEINKSMLSELTKLFGCHKLKLYLDSRFLPITSYNFGILTELTNDEDNAFEFFEYYIKPIFANKDSFYAVLNLKKIQLYFELIQGLVSFDEKSQFIEPYLEKAIYYAKLIDIYSLKQLTEKIMDNYLCLPSKKLSVLFEVRLNFIKKELEKLPPFDWSMPGFIQGHPALTGFLRNEEEQKMTYSGVFNSKYSAEEFREEFQGLKNGYSLKIQPFGLSKEAYVIITKTKEYYEQFLVKYKDILNERDKIENFLNQNINQNDI